MTKKLEKNARKKLFVYSGLSYKNIIYFYLKAMQRKKKEHKNKRKNNVLNLI